MRARRTPAQRKATGSPGVAKRRPANRQKSSTGGAFKLSSTRRAAVLALLVCVMALSVAVPLRTYLSQRDELAAQQAQQAELEVQVRQLEQRKQELSDPAQVEAEARARLGYVRPGETPYIVQVPQAPAAPPPLAPGDDGVPWYEEIWNSVMGKDS
ncbi:septum formation initiator family protein [Saccharopolyspora rhizosphaerae]|uniref:Septum formation initiator family protein n=1 Tax=Saccharopolyspora rhizosphaerae TaxID=2492662 RepID=A0A426JQS2_9PSEU|nr:septum formation initiator family protein [Saccharopolyspora rhizosphaerae]RRO15494.1 septum formation initiator family protein [Saccharopolyspora rhizosphaerae]